MSEGTEEKACSSEIKLSELQLAEVKRLRQEASNSLLRIDEMQRELHEAIEKMLAKRDSTNK